MEKTLQHPYGINIIGTVISHFKLRIQKFPNQSSLSWVGISFLSNIATSNNAQLMGMAKDDININR